MAAKAKAPPPPPPYSWQGFYIGGFAGGAWSGPETTSDPTTATGGGYNGVAPTPYNMPTGFTGGGEFGYKCMPNAFTVVGLEDKFGFLHLHSSIVLDPLTFSDTTASTTVGNWFDTYVARIGAVDGHVMLFLEGGGVTARIKTGVVDPSLLGGETLNTTTNKTITSWAAGGGLQYAINNNWSVKGEVLELGLHSTINSCGTDVPGGVNFCAFTKIGGVTMVDLGVDYAFK